MLTGYKTYIVATLLGLVAAAEYLGYIDRSMRDTIVAILTGAGLATLGAKINRLNGE